MGKKKEYGQFMTTNYKFILQNLKPNIDENTIIIEPFTGDRDLLKMINSKNKIICYDIDPKHESIIKQDTLLNPPDYTNKFVLTNPPYLAKNKDKNKKYIKLFEKYNTNDLYKCFIKSIINNKPNGGIIIIPVNFWSSIRQTDIDIRKEFLMEFDIELLNIFEMQVFNDTSYNVCAFMFKKVYENKNTNKIIKIDIYKNNGKKNINIQLNDNNNFIIGGEIYYLPINKDIKITRWTRTNKYDKPCNIMVKCIDTISMQFYGNKKQLFIDNTPNLSARTYMTLVIYPKISKKNQNRLCLQFNEYLCKERKKYESLFLTNYRDKGRKRISFDLVYRICNYLINNF